MPSMLTLYLDKRLVATFVLCLFLPFPVLSYAQVEQDDFDDFDFNDQPVIEEISYPEWFKQSFLNLVDDLAEAKDDGKKGIIVYFGQKHCAYCKALMENDFGQKDIAEYTQENFDVIALNIWGSKEVVTPEDEIKTERQYALDENANFTPTLIFYDTEGEQALKLRGYHPPYQFRAALEYVVEGYYQDESFRHYLSRADEPPKFEPGDLNEEDFFMKPPYALDRTRFKAQKPLLVFFEQRDCYACDVLHAVPLQFKSTRKLLEQFEVVQIDINSDKPVLTPGGEKLTGRQWAEKLKLFYTPTIIAYDEQGKEIMRIDSVAGVYRLKSVLSYIASKKYLQMPNFMDWRFNVLFGGKKLPMMPF